MSQAIEVVLFYGKPGVSTEQMMLAAQRAQPSIAKLPGFVSRSLGQAADGRYVDILHWQDMACAQAAAQAVMQCPICAEFFGLIDEGKLEMIHFDRAWSSFSSESA
jgi:hypothetical protein